MKQLELFKEFEGVPFSHPLFVPVFTSADHLESFLQHLSIVDVGREVLGQITKDRII